MNADYDTIPIRGYGCTFGQSVDIDGLTETVAGDAFDLRPCWDCRLLFGGHDIKAAFARTSDKSLILFQDSYGLGFEARLSTRTRGAISTLRAIASGETPGASVNFVQMNVSYRLGGDGRRHRIINRARIDHIAIVSQPTYQGTAVWLAESDVRDLPPRIAALHARWSSGMNSSQRAAVPISRNARQGPDLIRGARQGGAGSSSRDHRPPAELLARIDRLISEACE